MTWVSAGVGIGTAVLGGAQSRRDKKKAEARQAHQQAFENDRDKRIQLARGKIDSIFDSPQRAAQRNQFATSLRGQLGTQLDRQRVDSARNLKFALARSGLTGGKVAIDSNRRLGDEFADAAIGNERTVAGELAQLQAQDEQQRNALKTMAGQGMTLSEASRRANTAQQNTLATANSVAQVKGLGDVFADTAKTYKTINERAALRQGYGVRRADLYGRA